jgi:hypothetical protein
MAFVPSPARAQPIVPEGENPADVRAREESAAVTKQLAQLGARPSYLRLFTMAEIGDGLRFNNPYRLSHQLGETGESLSTTALYTDLAAGVTFGAPNGLQHGFSLAWSLAIEGVGQQVVTPSYVALLRGERSYLVYGRAGLPLILSPDVDLGGELAAGFAWFFTSGIGATGALVLDGFYGAGTRDVRSAFYPVLSAQAGVFVDYEVLR